MKPPPAPSRTQTAAFIALSLALTAPVYPEKTLPQGDCAAPRAGTDLRHCDLAGALDTPAHLGAMLVGP